MATNAARQGFFRSALEAMMAARERQASRFVAGALLKFDDATLLANGYTRAELEKRASVNYLL
jgi:hypothetical protein